MTSPRDYCSKPLIPARILAKWQRIVDLIASIVEVQACLVNKSEHTQIQLVVSSADTNKEIVNACEKPPSVCAFCQAVVENRAELQVSNALSDPKWRDSPDVKNGMMAYLGFVLLWPDGDAFGTLCVFDNREHEFSAVSRGLLAEFKAVIEADLADVEQSVATAITSNDDSKLWRAIQSAAMESILVLDKQGTFLSANEIGAKRFGMPPENLVGKNLYEIIPPEIAESRRIKIQEVIQAKRSLRFEDERQGRYFDFTIYPVLDSQHEVEMLVVFAADISERKITRDALEKSERKYRELVDEAATIILRWDIHGNVTFFNEFAQKFFGFSEEEILGKNVVGTIVPETEFTGRDLAHLMDEICRDPAKFEDNENENIKRNGERVWIAWKNRPIFNASGELYEIHSVGIDITARKQVEEALKLSEERQKKAQAVGRVGTWEWNLQSGELVWSDELFRIFGFSPDEIVPTYEFFLNHVHREDRDYVNDSVNKALEKKQIYNVDCRIIAKDGVEKTANAQGNVRYDEHGAPLEMLGTFQDITERKKIDKELEQYRSQLEELVAIRTSELEISNRELESYSYSIAHDLRSPLRAITGFSQILKDEAKNRLDHEDVELLDRIVAAGKNMSGLIDDILDLSRITRTELHYENVNLTRVGTSIIQRLKQSQPEREVEWQAQEGLQVQGDLRLLEVAMQNLIENAWKYTRNNPKTTITLGKEIINNEQVYFLKDNGVGFDMQYKNQLFKPFNRLHALEDFEGTGVGLATVQRIIERHGGRIWAQGEEKIGATFYFTLRIVNSH